MAEAKRAPSRGGSADDASAPTSPITIAVDVMGSDGGVAQAMAGLDIARARASRPVRFLVYGDAAEIEPALAARPALGGVCEVRHCDVAVTMEETPAQAIWRGRRVSSMWRALEAARDDEAQAALSSGNTGALMAMGKMVARLMPGVERHALAALTPNAAGGLNVLLDVGASFGADARRLTQHAAMGAAMATALWGDPRPSVGLLNIGREAYKGEDALRDAATALEASDAIEFAGFVEGDDVAKPYPRVFVVDGFTGNIALKFGEAAMRFAGERIGQRLRGSLRGRLAYMIARGHFRAMREDLNPSAVNGAVFLGLRRCVIKSHGGADSEGFAAAVERAMLLGGGSFIEAVGRSLAPHGASAGE